MYTKNLQKPIYEVVLFDHADRSKRSFFSLLSDFDAFSFQIKNIQTSMALFYVGYLIVVSSTVAFILAILTPRWIYPVDPAVVGSASTAVNDSSYRGIFYVDAGYPNGTCRDWILVPKDSIAPCRPSTFSFLTCRFLHPEILSFLAYAVACAALSIIGSSLSIILLWLAGGYLYVRRRRLAPHFVSAITALTMLICKFEIRVVLKLTCLFL